MILKTSALLSETAAITQSFSPEELDAYISRIETINRLKNKHGNP